MKQCLGWLVTVILLTVFVAVQVWGLCDDCGWPPIGNVLYYTLIRLVFPLILAWLILTCCSGLAGITFIGYNMLISNVNSINISKINRYNNKI